VANKIAKYNLLAVPVIEKDGSVVGFVTVDDVIDVLIEEGTEDILRMAGVEPGALDKPYFDNPVWLVVRKRIGWLLLLFVAETCTGTVLRHFESELAAVVALSFFIPLLIGTGGNAGSQTVTTIIRSLALKEIKVKDAWRVLAREASTGDHDRPAPGRVRVRPRAAMGRPHAAGGDGGHHDRGHLLVVDDGGLADPDPGRALRGGPHGAVRTADHDPRRRDGAGDLLLDREGGSGVVVRAGCASARRLRRP
jgi:CBS domain-containing protein